MKKILILVLLVLSPFCFFNLRVNAKVNSYNGKIICEDKISFNEILLIVSNSNLENSSFTVNVMKDGTFQFESNFDIFKISVDLNSIPDFYGVENKDIYIDSFSKKIEFKINRISDVIVSNNKSNFIVNFKDKSNNNLFVDYETEYNFENIKIINLESINTISYTAYIKTKFKTYTIRQEINLFELSIDEKLDLLFNIGLITNHEREEHTRYIDLDSYNYINQGLYIYNNRFYIIYEQDLSSYAHMSNTALQQLGIKLQNIESYFYNQGFNKPNTLNNRLYIYVVSVSGISSENPQGSYNPISNLIYLNKYNNGLDYDTISHEYFHAVQDTYNTSFLSLTFKESNAEFASYKFLIDTGRINSFYLNYYARYSQFLIDEMFCLDNLTQKMSYSMFILHAFIDKYYLNGDYFNYLIDYFSNSVTNRSTFHEEMNDFTRTFNHSFKLIFQNFVENFHPYYYILDDIYPILLQNDFTYNPSLEVLLYVENISSQTFTLPGYGIQLYQLGTLSTIPRDYLLVFDNIGLGIHISCKLYTISGVYTVNDVDVMSDGSFYTIVENLIRGMSYNVENILYINIYVSNTSNTNKSYTLNINNYN